VGFTTGSRGKVPGKTCEKRIRKITTTTIIIIIIIIKHSIDSLQKNSCTRNITHYKESATIRNLKPELWVLPLVQEEKYQEKPVKKRRTNNNTEMQLCIQELVSCSR
jgi:hypothetical protein